MSCWTRLRLAAVLVAMASLLASCATSVDPAADTIYGTPGRIVKIDDAKTDIRSGIVDVGSRGIPVPVAAPQTVRTRIYTLRTRAGEELRNRSARSFELGDCVVLWHGLRTFAQPGTTFNYMSGSLEPYGDCKD